MCVSHALCVSISMHKCVFNITVSGHVSLHPPALTLTDRKWEWMWDEQITLLISERERERERQEDRGTLSPLTPSAFSPASTHPVFLSSVFLIHAGKEHLQESMRSWERAVSHYKNIAFHTSCLYAVKLQQDLIRLACCTARSSIKLIIVSSSN